MTRGSARFRVEFDWNKLTQEIESLAKVTNLFNDTCQLVSSDVCNGLINNLQNEYLIIKEQQLMQQGLFPRRITRSLWSYLGAMDSEDRARIDSNLDRVRSNEENLKRRLESEVGVVTALYDTVANAS